MCLLWFHGFANIVKSKNNIRIIVRKNKMWYYFIINCDLVFYVQGYPIE